MINLCLVVIATQFAETKKRETQRMLEERKRLRSSGSLSTSMAAIAAMIAKREENMFCSKQRACSWRLIARGRWRQRLRGGCSLFRAIDASHQAFNCATLGDLASTTKRRRGGARCSARRTRHKPQIALAASTSSKTRGLNAADRRRRSQTTSFESNERQAQWKSQKSGRERSRRSCRHPRMLAVARKSSSTRDNAAADLFDEAAATAASGPIEGDEPLTPTGRTSQRHRRRQLSTSQLADSIDDDDAESATSNESPGRFRASVKRFANSNHFTRGILVAILINTGTGFSNICFL